MLTRRSCQSWIERIAQRTQVNYDVGIKWSTLCPFEFTPSMIESLNDIELDSSSYYVVDTLGDGNCALYALTFLYNIHNCPRLTPRTLRKIISMHVSRDCTDDTPINSLDFSLHSEFGEMSVHDCHGRFAQNVNTIKDYHTYITTSTTFLTECELNVLHVLFERPIVVCQPSPHGRIVSCVIQTKKYKHNRPMCLYYIDGNHYQLVISARDLNLFLCSIDYNV